MKKKIKQGLKKTLLVMLVSLMTFTSTFMSSITEINAASTWGEYVGTVYLTEKLENVAIPGLREGGNMYRITMNGEDGFCLNHYVITDTGYKYTRQDSKLSSLDSKVIQAANYYAKSPDAERYMLVQCIIWGLVHGAIDSFDTENETTQKYIDNAMTYIQGKDNWLAYKKRILKMNEIMWENNNWNAMQFIMHGISTSSTSTSGWHYYYRNNASQPILTKFSGVWVEPRLGKLNSTKTADEKVEVKFVKTDKETNIPLEGVEVSFYRDDKLLLGNVKTDSKGSASATFKQTHSATSDDKEYCLNWSDLSDAQKTSLTNQGVYSSRDAAQSAADTQAQQRADAIVASQTHTYKVVELNTVTNYYLDPNNTTVSKTITGSGTVNLSLGNQYQTGSISITKYDGETSQKVLGASYKLYASEPIFHPDGKTGLLYDKDEVVATFPSTDENGYSNLGNLHLGKYYILEDVAPYGYVLSTERYEVELTYAGQDVKVVYGKQDVTDSIQRGDILISKVDKELYEGLKDASITDFDGNGTQGDATLAGATYGLYVQSNIIHPDGKTGVISYNATDNDIYEIELTKGTDLVVYDTKATANTLIATAKTDENGQIEFSHLLLGDYYVKEISESEGYLLDDTKYDISLKYTDQTAEVSYSKKTVFETVKRQAFELYKGGHTANTSMNATPLEGVHFEVKLESDIQALINEGKTLEEAKSLAPLYDELITDSSGKATSIELPYGTYRVIETVPSTDYSTAEDFFVTVNEDSRTPQDYSNNVIIDEVFTAYLKLVKQDIETGKTVLLKDTTFKVRTLEDTTFNGKKFSAGEYLSYFSWGISSALTFDTWKTDETGTVLLGEKLTAGEYELVEITSPYGYLLNEEPVKFTITNGTTYEIAPDGNPIITATMKDVSVKGKVEVSKVGEVLTGAELDEDGNVQFIYSEVGIYGAEFVIEAAEDIYSADNQKDLIYAKGDIVETIWTSNGYSETSELPLGKYKIYEKTAGNGYVLNKEVKEVELTYKDQYTAVVFEDVDYVNERQKVEVTVTKKDSEDGTLLSGATFGLYAVEDIFEYEYYLPVRKVYTPLVSEGTLIETVTTDETGTATFTADLPLNHTFVIKELSAPKGYASTDYEYEFTTEYGGQDKEVVKYDAVFENDITKVEISKKDITNDEEIAGAFLIVYCKEDNSIIETWTSGSDGYNDDGTIKPHLIKGLEVGKTYNLEEIIAPYGFAYANEIEFTVLDTGEIQKVEMYDELVLGQLKWKKTGEIFNQAISGATEFGETLSPVWNEANLIGAEITIYAAEDITIGNHTYYEKDEEIETLISGEEDVLSKELFVGNYYYVETKAAEGYLIDTKKHYFKVENTMVNELQTIESTLLNTRATFEIDMIKTLEKQEIFLNEEAYKDIVFGIYAKEDVLNYYGNVEIPAGNMIATTGIDENGHLVNVPDLPYGKYFIKELATNSQYVLNDTEYEFELSYKGENVSHFTVMIDEDGIIDNELARGTISVHKVDSEDDERVLTGVVFNISINEDMTEPFMSVKTDDTGYAVFEELELGTYYIQDAEQVDGYIVNDHIYKVEVTADGDMLEITCENQPTEMVFSKVDLTTGKELPGATITVTDKETVEVVDKWVSTDEPHIIKYLVEGKEYIMTEEIAPDGYYKAESITFTAKDGEKITMEDKIIPKKTETPKTGDESNIIVWSGLAGSSVLLLAILLVLKKKKEEIEE